MCPHESVWAEEESKQKLRVSEDSSVSITINKSLRPTLSRQFSSPHTHIDFISAANVMIIQTALCLICPFIKVYQTTAPTAQVWTECC